jgi:hypothetical protein
MTTMPLRDRNIMPPGGFPFREPTLRWPPPKWNPYREFGIIVSEIQQVRAQNPTSGLNPSREAVAKALDDFTCKRLNEDASWCEETKLAQAAMTAQQIRAAVGKPKCGSCGSKKKR